jgi:hypothetical protein
MKSRRLRWVGHKAHMRELRNAYKLLVRKCKGKGSIRRLGTGGRIIILRWILRK